MQSRCDPAESRRILSMPFTPLARLLFFYTASSKSARPVNWLLYKSA